jgi:predicted AlkP superfamily pyrophosphatase or phosphodiesterase
MAPMRTISTTLFALTLLVAHTPQAHAQTTAPSAGASPRAQRALIISVDGMRPDVMLRAKTPVLRSLMEQGTFTMWARTTAMSITLPSHTSMLTGVTPERHGVDWNGDLKPDEQRYPKLPTLLDRARAAGFTTALAAGKTKFIALAREGTVDHTHIISGSDQAVAVWSAKTIHEQKPQVMFVHFPGADGTGHGVGWGTPQQLERIDRIDGMIGELMTALADAGVREQTLVIISADHGGAGRNHGPDDPRSRHIPWIAVGPGVRKGYDLTNYPDLVVNTEDTFATACWMLGIPIEPGLDGKPITQIIQQDELLNAAP